MYPFRKKASAKTGAFSYGVLLSCAALVLFRRSQAIQRSRRRI
jgi:hypothetical protein